MEFKIVLAGPAKTGKSSFLKKILFEENTFTDTYKPTLGVEVYPLKLNTNYGQVQLNIWDCAGDDRFGGLKNGYYLNANGAIIMADNNIETLNLIGEQINSIENIAGHIPTSIVINKCDLLDETSIHHNYYQQFSDDNPEIITLSTKNDDHVEMHEPLLLLLRKITNNNHLLFI